MALYCRYCGVSNFSTSRLRLQTSDLTRLLRLQFPVRCLTCRQRAFTPLSQFLELRNELRARRKVNHGTT